MSAVEMFSTHERVVWPVVREGEDWQFVCGGIGTIGGGEQPAKSQGRSAGAVRLAPEAWVHSQIDDGPPYVSVWQQQGCVQLSRATHP
jgi:hypothetical protein